MRKDAFLHPHDKHDRKFQSLSHVKRHQHRDVGFFLQRIHVRNQCNLLQEFGQCVLWFQCVKVTRDRPQL